MLRKNISIPLEAFVLWVCKQHTICGNPICWGELRRQKRLSLLLFLRMRILHVKIPKLGLKIMQRFASNFFVVVQKSTWPQMWELF